MSAGKVLVFGLGWLGTAFAKIQARSGRLVVGTVRSETRAAELRSADANLGQISIVPYELGRPLPEALKAFAGGARAVIALAPRGAGVDPTLFTDGMADLANQLSECGVGAITLISSTGVYPDDIPLAREEDAVDVPSRWSGISWLGIEQRVAAAAQDVPMIVLRFGGLFGPGRDPSRFLGDKLLSLPDDPVNMIHLDDCLGVLEAVGKLDRSLTLNACSPVHPSRLEFYSAAATARGTAPPGVAPGPRQSPTGRIVCTDRLLRETTYTFRHPDPRAAFS